MQKIKLLTKWLTKKDIDAAMTLLAEGGCDAGGIETVAEIGAPDPACDDELVVLIMVPAVCDDPSIETELKKTPNGGRRAICIWPEGTPGTAQPPVAASNYAYSIIPWSAGKFCAVAADDDVMCFETPDGIPMPKVKMEHNICVEEKKTKSK